MKKKKKKTKESEEKVDESIIPSQLIKRKGIRSKRSKKSILSSIVEHPNSPNAELGIAADVDEVARKVDELEPIDGDNESARMANVPEPRDKAEEMAVKVAEPKPKKKKLIKKSEKEKIDAEKNKKKMSSYHIEEKEAGSKGESPVPNPSSPNDAVVQTRIIESVLADIRIEQSPSTSEQINAQIEGGIKKLYYQPL